MFSKEKKRLKAEARAKREAAQSAVIAKVEEKLAEIEAITDPTDRLSVLCGFDLAAIVKTEEESASANNRKKSDLVGTVSGVGIIGGLAAAVSGVACVGVSLIDPVTATIMLCSGVGSFMAGAVGFESCWDRSRNPFLKRLDDLASKFSDMRQTAAAQCDVLKLVSQTSPDQIEKIFKICPDIKTRFNDAALKKEQARAEVLKPKPVISGTINKYAKLGDRRK